MKSLHYVIFFFKIVKQVGFYFCFILPDVVDIYFWERSLQPSFLFQNYDQDVKHVLVEVTFKTLEINTTIIKTAH